MYPPHPFCDEVDAAWRAKDYEQIGILIEERLAAYPDDPMALSMACHYHVFIDRAPDKFAKYVGRLRGVANRFLSAQRLQFQNLDYSCVLMPPRSSHHIDPLMNWGRISLAGDMAQ